MNKKAITQIVKAIKKANKIALFHHVGPDGDTLSSSYGLMKALQAKFPNKEIKWLADTKSYKRRFGYIVKDFKDVIETIDESWLAIIGDNTVKDRIYKSEEYIKAGIKVCFDHHTNDINFEHDIYWSEPKLGASSVQAFEIAKKLKVPFNSEIALGILFGILTDTFNFTYSLADTWPIGAAKELMKYIKNKDMDNMYKEMRKKTLSDVKFQAYALSNFKIESEFAYLKITVEDQKKLGVRPDQISRVNLIGNIDGIKVWSFFIEDSENDMIRCSLRSNGFPVNEVAKVFGGGGHIRASGIKLPMDWKASTKVIAETKKQLKKYKTSLK